ncbi:efflux RND transporter permease subunit [Kutzneria albida]|uniref:Hydrogenase expression protein n=1 Tax=Kutzneria albida DSM 43870 TaxID=1449976 RepID=W5W232_9PSEU|nr:efflux RND transporter permease subunit [Kutzneria albida]AHH94917.1 hypothetical protein KALB_1545 [Kutzneria albida DSM 43870]
MTSLTRLSLANRSLVALIALIALGFGAWAIPSLQRQLLPSLAFPAAVVVAQYPGASPQIVQDQVSKPIEDALRGVPGQTQLTSTSSQGSSSVTVQFDYGTNLDDAVNKMTQAVNRISAQLPTNVKPNVVVGNTDDLPVTVLAASSDTDQRVLAGKLTSTVVPALQGITGVRDVQVTGARDQVVTISVDNAKLAAAGLNATAISTALRSNGTPTPAGTLAQDGKTTTVQVGSTLSSVDDLKNLYLTPTATATPGRGAPPQPVRLGDVATVEQNLAPATSLTRTNGKDSLGVSVTKTPDGNSVDISSQIRAKLPELAAAVGDNAQLTVVSDQAPAINRAVEGLTTEGLLGLAFAVVVILIFLLSVRSTLVTAVSIPLSVVIALIVLWTTKTSLNLLTLGGLTIAVGRVVDDSIVVLENIKRHLSYGEDKKRAVIDGVREVAGAVTASTLTTVAVFAPIAVVGGLVGELFAPFGLTVTVALLASLLVALTIVPVLAYWFLKPGKAGSHEEAVAKELRSPLQRMYVPVIRFATSRRLITVLIAVLILFGTLAMVPRLKTNFLDGNGQNTLSVSQTLPVGSSLATTDAAAKQVESAIKGVAGVQTYQLTVGSSGGFMGFGGSGGTARASYSLTLDEKADVTAVQNDLRGRLDAIPNAGKITVGAGGGGGDFGGSSLQVIVKAPEESVLRSAAGQVQEAMSGISGVVDVGSDLANSANEVHVTVDRQAAAKLGLSDSTIGQAVTAQLAGSQVGQLTVDGKQENIILRTGTAPSDVDALKAVQLAPGVRLDAVAKVEQTTGPVQIKRIDGARSATVTGTATGQNTGAISTELRKKLDGLKLPAGASYSIGGVSQQQSEAFGNLGIALAVAVALVFLIMVAVFRSLIQPLVLLVSVPFAATGAIGALLVTGTPLGLPSLIGMLMLVGIVVTNAIVLMDLINTYRAQGMGIQEAVIEGGRRRLRPILMTAAATIFALLPMALGLTASGGFISQPLAVVVIGGLVSSTLLTLLLVPTLYTMVENVKERSRDKRAARRDPVPRDEPELVDAH